MNQDQLNELFAAIMTSNFEAAKKAIEDGAEVNYMLLQVAFRIGDTKMIGLLKQHGGVK